MAVTIRGRTLSLPILQGGMGIGVSLDRLAGAVAAKGGMGTISTAACGFQEPDFYRNTQEANLRALARQVKRAKELAAEPAWWLSTPWSPLPSTRTVFAPP